MSDLCLTCGHSVANHVALAGRCCAAGGCRCQLFVYADGRTAARYDADALKLRLRGRTVPGG